MAKIHLKVLMAAIMATPLLANQESLPPLKDGQSPQTIEAVWSGYDPTVEPLNVEVHKEWEENGVMMQAIRYRIGTFKGQDAWMGAYYGYPKGGKELPALVQIHGGGGLGSVQPCLSNAKRGYATISLSWRGDPRYIERGELPAAAQTDWGAVAGAQTAESRGIEPNNDQKYDAVPSGRNDGYFLRTLAARRALTFLEQRPEVDGDKLGVYGHSMGGVITTQTAAIDSRVKATAPSCAPPLLDEDTLKTRTATAAPYAALLSCPVLWMAPTNDFHGIVEDLEWMTDHMPSKDFRFARSEHLNHKHNASSWAANLLWFDDHLKGSFEFPELPQIEVKLNATDGRPVVIVKPEASSSIARVDLFYTRDAKYNEYATVKTRFWKYAEPTEKNGIYSADLDLFELDEPLWVFANVHYKLEGGEQRYGAETLNVSTRAVMIGSDELKAAVVKAPLESTHIVESFDDNWAKEWTEQKDRYTSFRINDPRVPIPEYSKLVFELKNVKAGKVLIDFGGYRGTFVIKNASSTHQLAVYPFDLEKKGSTLLNWNHLTRPSLTFGLNGQPIDVLEAGGSIYWETISEEEYMVKRPVLIDAAEQEAGHRLLSLMTADRVVGRTDLEHKQVKTTYKKGMQVHSHSELLYFTGGRYNTFHAVLIPGHQSSVTFEVYADDTKIFDSGRMGGKSEPKEIDLDIIGSQSLKMVVTEGGNGWGGDWVMWGDAWVK